MNKYLELRKGHREEVENFPMFFAFNAEQFIKGMKKFGLDPKEDKNKIYDIGMGGFIKKSDDDKFDEMMTRHDREIQEAISQDKTGEGFIKDMFRYELGNHEYIVTFSYTDTLDVLGLTMEEVKEDKALKNGLEKARKEYLKQFED